jgi:hypothetical protein
MLKTSARRSADDLADISAPEVIATLLAAGGLAPATGAAGAAAGATLGCMGFKAGRGVAVAGIASGCTGTG